MYFKITKVFKNFCGKKKQQFIPVYRIDIAHFHNTH